MNARQPTPEAHSNRGGRSLLTLWELIVFGIVLVQPIAPVPIFGIAQKLSNGHTSAILLFAMSAMVITAVSYGRMAALFPSAGSAYTYVGEGLNRHLGFLVGWAMSLEYLIAALLNTVWLATALHTVYTPRVPYIVWNAIITILMMGLNLLGVKTGSRANKAMLYFMFIVVACFAVLAVRFLYHQNGWAGFSTRPFYDPATFDSKRILQATSFAVLTYIGFDGVTTLGEDVERPRRNILLATVFVCLFTGVVGCLEVYLAQLVWPDWHSFQSLETAFIDVCGRIGGAAFYNVMGFTLVVASFGAGLACSLGAAKLLFGMGRDNVLPRRFFGYHARGSSTPSYNVILVGLLSFAVAELLDYYGDAYQHAGELINFGAFLAFMGVNLATFWQFAVVRRPGYTRRIALDIVLPIVGFIFCALIWWNLGFLAKTAGGIWFVLGVIYLLIRTHGFRRDWAAPAAPAELSIPAKMTVHSG
jgi:putrescine importer